MSQKLSDFSVLLPIDQELFEFLDELREKLYDFNHARPKDKELREDLLKSILGSCDGVNILPPFHCDLGRNIHFKRGGFLNTGVTILDIAPVTIGDYVQIGPNAVLATAGHPLDLTERVKPMACGDPITVGDNVWIGAGAVVLGGVSIGDRSVIGAGSVVTKDIPPDSVAVGNPCRVVKSIEHSPMPSEEELEAMWKGLM